jgi:hypothetical protein
MKKEKFKFNWPHASENSKYDLFVIMKNRYMINRIITKISKRNRPNVSTVLWWDWDYKKMDFRKAHISVIQRILEYGNPEEWSQMIRFYGLNLILHDIKYEIWYLRDHAIDNACNYFSLQKEEIKCYHWKQSRPNYWL